ncbi:MAG: hypothetical protein H7138_11020 [Myxococcales bacterium]|nr:hypothetical protein [Myxococcales bacterium]
MLGCESSPAAPYDPSQAFASTGGSGTSGTSEGTTFDGTTGCQASRECEAGFCVAPYDAGAGTGALGMGAAACVPECVPVGALHLWCIDDDACCDGSSCDPIDGFCVGEPADTGESSIGESWSTGSSSDGSGSSSGEASSSETTAGESSSSR